MDAFLNSVPFPLAVLDSEGVVVSTNAAAQRSFAAKKSDLEGIQVQRLVPSLIRADGCLSDLYGVRRELEARRLDGGTFPARILLRPVRDGLLLLSVEDRTEHLYLERLRSEFISNVSHEIRTPLSALRGGLGLVVNGVLGEVSAEAQQVLEIAHGSVERLSSVLDDILDAEKIRKGELRLRLERCDAKELVEAAHASAQARAEAAGVTLRVTGERGLSLPADRERVLQVLGELLENALKFSPPAGAVEVDAHQRGSVVRFRVSDEGPGVPREDRERLFRRFEQLDGSSAREHGGVGIGLSLAKSIVETHGGKIGFDERPQGGSEFWFELALERSSRRFAPLDLAADEGARAILVVEDDKDLSRVLCLLLEAEGYVTRPARTLAEARAALAEGSFKAALLDVALPDGNGLDLLPELRALGTAAVIASGSGATSSEQPWLRKPFAREDITAALRAVEVHDGPSRVLIVEDDPDTRQVLAIHLEQEEFLVTEARDGQEALEAIQKRRPDLIVLDVTLPRLDGFQLVALLREQGLRTPLVVFTGRSLGRRERAALELGPTRFLYKSSAGNEEIIRAVRELLTTPPHKATPGKD